MKIALVNKFYPPVIGGIEYHVRTLANNLARLPDIEKIEILVANDHNEDTEENLTSKIHIKRLANWKTIASTPIAPHFAEELKKLDVDIFHFHFPYPFGDFSWLLSGNRTPFIITYHSDIIRQKYLNKLYEPVRNSFFAKASRIIATSPNLVKSSAVLQRHLNKIEIVPLGIDPSIYLDKSTVELSNILKKKFLGRTIVLFVGRLVYYKGVEVLIEAFRGIEAELIMIGEGLLEDKLHAMVDSYGMSDNVHFYSNITDDELAAYFNACDIFVLPSIASTEAYGLVQLEAQACAKPVISTNLPTGVPFVNKNNETGLVVEPNDVIELNRAIKKLIEDKNLREKLGGQGQKRMLSEFTDIVMAKRVHNIYSEILGERK